MVHHEQGAPLGPQRPQQVDNGPLRNGVYALKRFVHQVDPGVLHQGARQKNALLLPPGQLPNLPTREIFHAHARQRLPRLFAFAFPRPAYPSKASVAPHHHHVQHAGREIPVHAAPLRDIGNLLPGRLVRRVEEPDAARRHRQQAQQGLDEGGFPGAVRSHDGHEHPGGHGQVNVPQDGLVSIGDSQVAHFYGRRAVQAGSGARAATMASMFARIMPG